MHHKNMPMQYTDYSKAVNNKNFQRKNFDIFHTFAQNINSGYSLEPPWQGSSNEYPQSMFMSKNKKNRYTLHAPTIIFVGCIGYIHVLQGHVFLICI